MQSRGDEQLTLSRNVMISHDWTEEEKEYFSQVIEKNVQKIKSFLCNILQNNNDNNKMTLNCSGHCRRKVMWPQMPFSYWSLSQWRHQKWSASEVILSRTETASPSHHRANVESVSEVSTGFHHRLDQIPSLIYWTIQGLFECTLKPTENLLFGVSELNMELR